MASRTDRNHIAPAISLSESHRYRETSPVSAAAAAAELNYFRLTSSSCRHLCNARGRDEMMPLRGIEVAA